MKNLVIAQVDYTPAYFNRNVNATIPACFRAEVIEGCVWIDAATEHEERRIYAMEDTRQEVVEQLIEQLHAVGEHGRLRLV